MLVFCHFIKDLSKSWESQNSCGIQRRAANENHRESFSLFFRGTNHFIVINRTECLIPEVVEWSFSLNSGELGDQRAGPFLLIHFSGYLS